MFSLMVITEPLLEPLLLFQNNNTLQADDSGCNVLLLWKTVRILYLISFKVYTNLRKEAK